MGVHHELADRARWWWRESRHGQPDNDETKALLLQLVQRSSGKSLFCAFTQQLTSKLSVFKQPDNPYISYTTGIAVRARSAMILAFGNAAVVAVARNIFYLAHELLSLWVVMYCQCCHAMVSFTMYKRLIVYWTASLVKNFRLCFVAALLHWSARRWHTVRHLKKENTRNTAYLRLCSCLQVQSPEGDLQVLSGRDLRDAFYMVAAITPSIRKEVRRVFFDRRKGFAFRRKEMEQYVVAGLVEHLMLLLARRVPHRKAPRAQLAANRLLNGPGTASAIRRGGNNGGGDASDPILDAFINFNISLDDDDSGGGHHFYINQLAHAPTNASLDSHVTPRAQVGRELSRGLTFNTPHQAARVTKVDNMLWQNAQVASKSSSSGASDDRGPVAELGGIVEPLPGDLLQSAGKYLSSDSDDGLSLRPRMSLFQARDTALDSSKPAAEAITSKEPAKKVSRYTRPRLPLAERIASSLHVNRRSGVQKGAMHLPGSSSKALDLGLPEGLRYPGRRSLVVLKRGQLCYKGAIARVLQLTEMVELLNVQLHQAVSQANAMLAALAQVRQAVSEDSPGPSALSTTSHLTRAYTAILEDGPGPSALSTRSHLTRAHTAIPEDGPGPSAHLMRTTSHHLARSQTAVLTGGRYASNVPAALPRNAAGAGALCNYLQ